MNYRFPVLLLAFAAFTTDFAKAAPLPDLNTLPVVISIDVSDHSNITFTGTLANSYATDSSQPFFSGITFVNFLAGSTDYPSPIAVQSNHLMPVGNIPDTGSDHYNSAGLGLISSTPGDLNFFSRSSDDQIFTAGSPAFTGTDAIDFDFWYPSFIAYLPTSGTKGYLYSGFSSGVVIGAWQVSGAAVPEPADYGMLIIGLTGVVLVLRPMSRTAGA